MIGLQHYLALSGLMFGIAVYGILTRRSVLLVLLSVELALNAANLSFVAFSSFRGDIAGQVVVFFTMIVAAAEVTVGLAIVLLLFRRKNTTELNRADSLKW